MPDITEFSLVEDRRKALIEAIKKGHCDRYTIIKVLRYDRARSMKIILLQPLNDVLIGLSSNKRDGALDFWREHKIIPRIIGVLRDCLGPTDIAKLVRERSRGSVEYWSCCTILYFCSRENAKYVEQNCREEHIDEDDNLVLDIEYEIKFSADIRELLEVIHETPANKLPLLLIKRKEMATPFIREYYNARLRDGYSKNHIDYLLDKFNLG